MTLVNTGMGLPPVVVGLFVAIILWRSGPLGELGWIYTTKAMIVAQVDHRDAGDHGLHGRLAGGAASAAAAAGVRAGRVAAADAVDPAAGGAAAAAGGDHGRASARRSRRSGASVMVGGNIAGQTRVLTGAVLLEQSKGNFGVALALGIILLAMMIAVNALFTWVQLGIHRDAARRASARPGAPTRRWCGSWLNR